MSDPVVELKCDAPLDEAYHDEILEAGSGFAEVVNTRPLRRGGRTKRLAFAALSKSRFDATTRTEGRRLLTHRDRISVIGDSILDTYTETKSLSASANRVPEASVSVRPLALVDVDNVFDFVHCNGYLATAALVQDSVNYVVVCLETTDGVVVRSAETVFTSTSATTIAALGAYGNVMILLAQDASTADIYAYKLDTTSAATIASGWVVIGTTVATDRTTTTVPARAISTQSLTDRVAFAYINNSGGTSRVTVKTLDATGVLETQTINTSSTTPNVVSVEGSIADTLWVCWNESTACKLIGLTGNSLATVKATTGTLWTYTTAPTRPCHIVSSTTAGAGRAIGVDGDNNKSRASSFTTSAGAVVPGTANLVTAGYIYGRPLAIGGRYYALAYGGSVSNPQKVAVVGDFTDIVTATWFRPVANPFPGLVPTITSVGRGIAHPWLISATSAAFVVTVQRSAAALSTYLVTLDFADIARWRAESHNGSTFLSGGVLSYYDGRRVAEAAFLQSPVVSTSLGGTGITGTFNYVATFDEVDNDGNWCISGVSSPVSAAPANQTVSVSSKPLVLTSRLTQTSTNVDPRVRVSFWRTQNGGAAPYYYVGSVSHSTSAPTLADATSDAVLVTQRLLYGTGNLPGTNGAPQDHRAPPYASHLVSYNGMLVVASGADLYWSGQTIGGEGTWWSPAFYLPTDADITALAAQDGTLYVWHTKGISAVSGDAPFDNGANGGLGAPRKLAVDVGSIDGHTCVTELGIFFRSERGIEILGRGGAVTWIGERVQTTLESYPVVTSMVLDDKNNLVRISLAASVSSGLVSGGGRTLIFDLAEKAWEGVDDITGSASHEAAQDATVVTIAGERRYAYLAADGTVRYERLASDASAHLDGSTWVTQRAVTPWVRIAGINGEQFIDQVILIARRYTSHDLTISLGFDFADTYASSRTFTAANIDALAKEWLVKEVSQTTSQAVRVKLEDATPSSGTVGSGKGATWLALTFNGQPHRGPKRTSGAQRGGT